MARLSNEDIKLTITNIVAQLGDTVMVIEYNASKSLDQIKCSKCGDLYVRGYCSLKIGSKKGFNNACGCRKCAAKLRSEALRGYNISDVNNHVSPYQYKLISKEYINNHQGLEMECPIGHKICMSFANFKSGRRCIKCAMIKVGQDKN